MSDSTLLFDVHQPGVKARLWSAAFANGADPEEFGPGTWDERMSTPDGSIGFQRVPAGRTVVWFSKAGYQPQTLETTLPDDGVKDITLTPSGDATGFLRAAGPDRCPYFIDEDGHPYPIVGYSMHLALPMLRDEGDTWMSERIQEAVGYGYNTLITIGSHLSDWKKAHGFYMDPWASDYPARLARLFDLAAEQRVRVAHAVCADMQGRSTEEIQRAISISAQVMRGRWNVLARKGNECNVNGYDPHRLDFGDLGGVPWSQGSAGEGNAPVFPHGTFSEWESRRHPYHKSMDDSGAGILEQNEGYSSGGVQVGPWRCPILMIEGKYFHDSPKDKWGDARDTDPALALQQGLEIGANCAGGGFGASDGLECLPLGPVAAACARAQARGQRAAFLR